MKLFEHLHVQYSGDADNIKTECIWCGSDSLSADVEPPHQFQCWKCKQTGNAISYLRKWYENLPALTVQQAKLLCTLKKGIKPLTVRDVGIRFFDDHYWFPVYNQKNHLMAVHRYATDNNIWYSSPKPVSLTVLGLQNLSKSDTVWVCEGHPTTFVSYLRWPKQVLIF